MLDPDKIKNVRIAACDLNGQMRGKILPKFEEKKFKDGSIRMPLSALKPTGPYCTQTNSVITLERQLVVPLMFHVMSKAY